MDLKTYDTAFIERLGAATQSGGPRGYWLDVVGIDGAVPCSFDLAEEWFRGYRLPGVNVRRVDLVPDPSRFLPGFRGQEVSSTLPNTFNVQKDPAQPVNILYEVQMAAATQGEMNALLQHTLTRLPSRGYGTTINAFGHSMPFRASSIRNLSWNMKQDDGRKFAWSYTYSVEAWLASLECTKVPQILQVDLTILDGDGYTNTMTVTES